MVFPRVLVLFFVGAATLFAAEEQSAFNFQRVDYFHRWSGGAQQEFTPADQEDLEHWTDMVTINTYPDVNDGEKLAEAANAVLGNYKRAGNVVRTDSVPASGEKPAEHFICVVFTRPDFVEAAFARLKLQDAKGYSFVYSHRFYGEMAPNEMSAWLKANGEKTEKALMDWKPPIQ